VPRHVSKGALYGGRDPRDLPAYALSTASSYVQVPKSTLRSWIEGRTYDTERGTRRTKPLILAAAPGSLSFWNLSEAFVLAAIRRRHGVPLQNVRKALDYVIRELNVARPLIQEQFRTDGVHLFVDRCGHLINTSRSGQLAMKEALKARLERIEFDEHGFARRLFPFTRAEDPMSVRSIEIDPTRGFGRALLVGTSIPVDVVVDRFLAGESHGDLALDYHVAPTLIEDVIRLAVQTKAA